MKQKRTSGFAFLVAMAAFGLILICAFLTLAPILQGRAALENDKYDRFVAQTLAESGVHKAMSAIENGQDANLSGELKMGRYEVKANQLKDRWVIESKGISRQIGIPQIQIDAVVENRSGKLVVASWSERSLYVPRKGK